jgi:16S rRNA (cytosine1402-N4)-methyltransferase
MMYHQPVLLHESIEGLNIRPDGTYIDATYGGGGHSKEILKHLITGKLVAFDMDGDAEKNKIDNEHLLFVRHNFRYMKNFIKYYNISQVDGILADLGVSSYQFDQAERGFSFRSDAVLDMRMNNKSHKNAAAIINTYSEEKLSDMFFQYGELSNARKLAATIVKSRQQNQVKTINQFVETIKTCIPKYSDNKYLAQVFQSIRIEVNNELGNLKELLKQSVQLLADKGRLVVITYHSLEDRLVKNFMRTGNFDGKPEKDFYGNVSSPFRPVNKNVIVPSEDEIKSNNRARSAKLRVAERLG